VVFDAHEKDPDAIRKSLEEKLRQTLGYDVTVFVRTFSQLKQILALEPFRGKEEADADFQVTFLSELLTEFPLKLPHRIPNSTADVVSAFGAEVFSVTRGHGDGGKPNPFLEKTLKLRATTRNWNVIKEIVEKYPQAE
jgi:uncharacterized protein (DUF1697 family)